MAMFDSIITEADERFNLNGKAGTLLSSLLALMTDGTSGGFAGFLEKFNTASFGDAASSWVDSGVNTNISNEQLESALGAETLTALSNQIGTDYAETVSAAAFITPRIVDVLSPEGALPQDSDLLSRIGGFLNEAESPPGAAAEIFDRVDAAASDLDTNEKFVGNFNISGRNLNPGVDKIADSGNQFEDSLDKDNNSPLGWILPLLLLGLLLIVGYRFCSKYPEPAAPVMTDANSNRTAAGNNINAANQ